MWITIWISIIGIVKETTVWWTITHVKDDTSGTTPVHSGYSRIETTQNVFRSISATTCRHILGHVGLEPLIRVGEVEDLNATSTITMITIATKTDPKFFGIIYLTYSET